MLVDAEIASMDDMLDVQLSNYIVSDVIEAVKVFRGPLCVECARTNDRTGRFPELHANENP